ncbi:MAG: TOTE conflict system archaeo-eukaryotic primase domain-containing protein [Halarcobacter ebronensis]|uniref:TOTE conflict system archaeo-eukaryotic primase domain-containing protein n=1 Tax=Halarcobacter ebronensis TaxID=1462615 RepID=UPI003C735F10
MNHKKIEERLKELYEQKTTIEKEIETLEAIVNQKEKKSLSKDEKIELFKSLFFARTDIFAKKWTSKDGSKQAFYPLTQTFRGSDYLPLTNNEVELHLRGKVQLASYLINQTNKSKYIVLEVLEKDISKILKTFASIDIEALFEYSSYNSILVWVFFEKELETKSAKTFAQYILKKSNISAKIFPTKEFVTNGSFDEPIELPLHLKFRDSNKTVFFEPNSKEVYKDQWKLLQNISKVSEKIVLKYNDFEKIDKTDLLFDDIEFPLFKLEIKLYDYLYVPTQNLSRSFINKLKAFASFDNPQVKVLLSLRKPLYNTPRVIKNFEEDENYLKLPRGLIYQISKYLDINKVDFKIDDKTYCEEIETKKVLFELRSEQQEAIDRMLKKRFSICVAPPGFGKTLLGAKMFEQRACSTLIIVNKNMLLDQWRDRFVEYFDYKRADIGFLGKSKNKLNGKIDVATMQSLKNSPEIINNYSFVIVDECHHIPAVTFEQIVKQFYGKYILGLSATPKRKDGLDPILFQQLGDISYEYKKKKTFNNKLEIIRTDFISEADNYATLINELCVDETRNGLIIEQIKLHQDRKILILTDRIEHINALEKLLENEQIDYVSIHGSMSKKEQSEKIKLVESKSLILATTSYFGEGIDFPHLNTIIFATPISYYGRLIQYLGRIGRGNQECLAIDFLDNKNAMLNSAYKKRLEGYKQMHYL